MDRVEQLQAEMLSLLGLDTLEGTEVIFKKEMGRGGYLSIKRPGKELEDIWDEKIVTKFHGLWKEQFAIKEAEKDEQLWQS